MRETFSKGMGHLKIAPLLINMKSTLNLPCTLKDRVTEDLFDELTSRRDRFSFDAEAFFFFLRFFFQRFVRFASEEGDGN